MKDLAKVVPYAQLCLNGQGVDFLEGWIRRTVKGGCVCLCVHLYRGLCSHASHQLAIGDYHFKLDCVLALSGNVFHFRTSLIFGNRKPQLTG